MRIAVSGTANSGKSTLIKAMLERWRMYRLPDTDYRSIIADKPHSSRTNEDTQWAILQQLVDTQQSLSKDDNIIMDRCTLDNIVYTTVAAETQDADGKYLISDAFVNKCIPIVRESLRHLDIILWCPMIPIPIEDNGVRDIDMDYIMDVDMVFGQIHHVAQVSPATCPLLPKDDMPAIIKLSSMTTEGRIKEIEQYLDISGQLTAPCGITEMLMSEQAKNAKRKLAYGL